MTRTSPSQLPAQRRLKRARMDLMGAATDLGILQHAGRPQSGAASRLERAAISYATHALAALAELEAHTPTKAKP